MARGKIKKILILILNIVLYLIYGNYLFPIIITSILTFFLGKKIYKNNRFYLSLFTYLIILAPLIFFKYLINIIGISILIPLGISYYTLNLISYISDIRNKRYNPCTNLLDFMLYCLYFPCLFIGPINRYNDFIKEINTIRFNKNNLFNSLLRIGLGLIKKIIIANKLSSIIALLSSDTSYTGLYVLFGLFTYSFLLYCDFSGGIDIVLGISKIFNINLVENFDKPYLSESVKEFWRRWHISLGTWLKDYIYIPLGGNKEGNISTKINVLITFFISGIWHGLHYILWGIINGVFVILNIKTKNRYINIILTFIIISFLWIFFIYNDTFLSIEMFISIFKSGSFDFFNLGLNLIDYLIIIIFLIVTFVYELRMVSINSYLNKQSIYKKIMLILLIIFVVLLFGNYGLDVNSNNFIYGNF